MPPFRIFLVDDHPIVRYGLKWALRAEHHLLVVGEAENGEAACAWLATEPADVLILDLRMAGMSGMEVARYARARHPGIKILVLTAREDEESQRRAFEAGADGYLLKTADMAAIVEAIHTLTAGHVMQAMDGEAIGAGPPGAALLSERELQVLTLISKGLSNKAVGQQLNISDRTVQTHLTRIYHKLEVTSRTEAVLYALAHGWVSTGVDYEI